ncbi:MAG: hypothetical protein ACR2FO_07745 [Actinomycetota bacterium]
MRVPHRGGRLFQRAFADWVPGKPSDTLHPKTLGSVLKQASLKGEK